MLLLLFVLWLISLVVVFEFDSFDIVTTFVFANQIVLNSA